MDRKNKTLVLCLALICLFSNAQDKKSGKPTIKELSINSNASDFAPSWYNGQLIFSSARDTGLVIKHVDAENDLPFQKLYTAEISETGMFDKAVKFSRELDSKANQSTTSFSKDGNTIYFTRNNFDNGNFKRGKKGFSRLKIYRANLEEGQWKNITELPFCNEDYSVAHPALSPDGTKLYFASDMPGSLGESDLYSVDIAPDGSFGTPQNLGSNINTAGRETFPYVSDTGILYFTSDGHLGLGGLDIFAIPLENLQNGCVINLGEPINGDQDDFGIIMDETNQKGYFASNRTGGNGSDDIYEITMGIPLEMDCSGMVAGIITDKETGMPLTDATITLSDSDGNIMIKGSSKENGHFNLEIKYSPGQYNIMTKKQDYEDASQSFYMDKNNSSLTLEKELEPIEKAAHSGTDLIAYLNIPSVHFDLDQYAIRKDAKESLSAIATYMKTFPKTKIEVRSYTDASAGKEYNQKLSELRAQATVDYLISLGIEATRLVGKGFGETGLLNQCDTREKCSDKEHELNRRSEFMVIE